MKFTRVRYSLRSLLLVVAVTGVAFGLHARRSQFQKLATSHLKVEAAARLRADMELKPTGTSISDGPTGRYCRPDYAAGFMVRHVRFLCIAAHHRDLARKYQEAANQPWWIVAADPPAPVPNE